MVRIKHRYLLVHILYPESSLRSHQSSIEACSEDPPYLLQFHRSSPDDLTLQLLSRAVKDEVAYLYGDYGAGLVAGGLSVKYLSQATSTAIIRCSRNHYQLVWAALSFMTHLPKNARNVTPRPCVMQVVRVSGTIKKVEEEAIKRAKSAILRAKKEDAGGITDGLMAALNQKDDAGVNNANVGARGMVDGSDGSESERGIEVGSYDEG